MVIGEKKKDKLSYGKFLMLVCSFDGINGDKSVKNNPAFVLTWVWSGCGWDQHQYLVP